MQNLQQLLIYICYAGLFASSVLIIFMVINGLKFGDVRSRASFYRIVKIRKLLTQAIILLMFIILLLNILR